MIPFILFCSVALVGVLSAFAMISVARKRVVAGRGERARIAARAAQLAQLAQNARSAQLPAEPAIAEPPPAPVSSVGLTALFATLEDSALFTPPPPPGANSPRSRLAKGSVPIPLTNRSAIAPATAVGPYATVRSAIAPGTLPAPPPIPPRRLRRD